LTNATHILKTYQVESVVSHGELSPLRSAQSRIGDHASSHACDNHVVVALIKYYEVTHKLMKG